MHPPSKILVVDDEPDLEPLMLQRMRRHIQAGHYTFLFAKNGLEALDQLNQDKDIDVVISDINMPKMDGLTLLGRIREINPHVRSIVISAYDDMKNIRTAMNRGAFDFVTKPLDFEDLHLTIDRTLAHLREWREALASRDNLLTLQNELNVAGKIQQSILPTRFHENPDYQIVGQMEPARNLGGDFFDVLRLQNGRIGLVIADVSDKGVPAALFMMCSRTLIKGAAIGNRNPGDVLHAVNNLLCEDNDVAMFVTVFYAVYDPKNGELSYANGGHNAPLIIHADGRSTVIPMTGGIALGVVPDFQYGQETVTVSPGDILMLYTDGVTEAMNADDQEFGLERLREIFAAAPPKNSQECNTMVFEAVKAFAGDTPQSDDVTCLTFHRKEAET